MPTGCDAQEVSVKRVNVLLKILLHRDGASGGNKRGDHASAAYAIGNCVEGGRIGVTLESPTNSTPLTLVLLFQLVDGDQLFFNVITTGPFVIIKASNVSLIIQRLDLREQRFFLDVGVISQISAPPSERLEKARTHENPPVDNISAPPP